MALYGIYKHFFRKIIKKEILLETLCQINGDKKSRN